MKTDKQLQHDVMAELNWEPSVNAARIGVEVKDGIVTLTGYVDSYAEKLDAEHAAQRVAGVMALAIEIYVMLRGTNEHNDAYIARLAENVLQWTASLQQESIRVMVENGHITLRGTVDWEYQRQAAATAVRYLMGVTGVSNQLATVPNVIMNTIKADIEAAVKRHSHADAQQLSVTIDGSSVTLQGAVHRWTENNLATHSAWGTPGLLDGVDKMAAVY